MIAPDKCPWLQQSLGRVIAVAYFCPSTALALANILDERIRGVLVTVQVALALVLVGSDLMIRTFLALQRVDPGFSDATKIYVTGEAIPPDADITTFPFDNNAGNLFVQRMSLDGQSPWC